MRYGIRGEKEYLKMEESSRREVVMASFPFAKEKEKENSPLWSLRLLRGDKEEWEIPAGTGERRILSLLEGNAVLRESDERSVYLREFEQERYIPQKSVTVFGSGAELYMLTVREGVQAFLEILRPEGELEKLEIREVIGYRKRYQTFYLMSGEAALELNGKMIRLKEGEQMISQCDSEEDPEIRLAGTGILVRCQIFADPEEEEIWRRAEEIYPAPDKQKMEAKILESERSGGNVSEKTSVPTRREDFRECVFLSLVQFRVMRGLSPRFRRSWFSAELQDSIERINRFFVTDLILFAGLIGVIAWGAVNWSAGWTVFAAAAWILLNVFLIDPLIYLLVVPRPVGDHIRDIRDMTEAERMVALKQKKRNIRSEKLMRRFRAGVEYGSEPAERDKEKKIKKM